MNIQSLTMFLTLTGLIPSAPTEEQPKPVREPLDLSVFDEPITAAVDDSPQLQPKALSEGFVLVYTLARRPTLVRANRVMLVQLHSPGRALLKLDSGTELVVFMGDVLRWPEVAAQVE